MPVQYSATSAPHKVPSQRCQAALDSARSSEPKEKKSSATLSANRPRHSATQPGDRSYLQFGERHSAMFELANCKSIAASGMVSLIVGMQKGADGDAVPYPRLSLHQEDIVENFRPLQQRREWAEHKLRGTSPVSSLQRQSSCPI